MDSPFVNVDLEQQVLRLLIIDDRKDSDLTVTKISKNISYILTTGFQKEIFTGDFRQWVFDELIKHYISFTEAVSRNVFVSKLSKIYSSHLELKKHVILLDKILEIEFKNFEFKTIVEELKHLFNYRSLYNININLLSRLKEDSEQKKNDSISLARNVEESVTKILSVTDRFRSKEEDAFQNLDADIADLRDRKINPEKYKGISTGFESIDKATGGWIPGELTIILGRPGMGKSILLLNFGYHAYRERCNIFYVTIEMPLEQQKRRLQCRIADVPYKKIKMPQYLEDTEIDLIEKRLRKVKEEQKNYFWFIDAPEKCNAAFIESRVLAFEITVGKRVELLIIDPIYLMTPMDKKTDDPVGSISWDLKILGRKLDLPILAASQFNREGGKRHQHGKGVDTMDAAFSDKLGNNSDNMIGITGDKKEARLTFPKTRDSEIQDVFLEKEFEYMRFKLRDTEDKQVEVKKQNKPTSDDEDDDE